MDSEHYNKFLEKYNKDIVPKLEKLETIRVAMLEKYNRTLDYYERENILNVFKETVKKEVFNDLYDCFDFITDKTYGKISKEEFEKLQESKLISFFNTKYEAYSYTEYCNFSADDSAGGVYKGVPFKFHEFNLVGILRSKYMEYFFKRGLAISIKINKLVKSQTIIVPKKSNSTLLIILAFIAAFVVFPLLESFLLVPLFFQFKTKFSLYATIPALFFFLMIIIFIAFLIYYMINHTMFNKVSMEDPEFIKKYDVMAEDQIESRYLLTTGFMERFKNLKSVFGGEVTCCFTNDEVIFVISTCKDLFEIAKINIPITNPKMPEVFYKEMMAVIELIDYFKLNERTGL